MLTQMASVGVNVSGNVSAMICRGNFTAKELFSEMAASSFSKALLIFSTLLTGITLVIFMEIVVYVSIKVPYGARRGYTIFLLGLFPVFSVTSLASIYVPRAAIVASWAASLYLSLGLYIFILLILAHFRGIDTMVRRLQDVEITLAQPPLACCCPCCCSKIKLTHQHIHRLRLVVLQSALIQPLTLFIASILWTDGLYIPAYISKTSAFLYLTLISLISTLVGVYGLTVFYKVSIEPLKKYWIKEKFIALKIVMIVPNVQTLLLAILVRSKVIKCIAPFSASLVSSIIYNALVICEMFILIASSRYVIYKLRQRNRRRRESSLLELQNMIVPQHQTGCTQVKFNQGSKDEINDVIASDEMKAPEGSRIVRYIETDV
ncbi:organic solute transporter subunit alpha-like [Amphiura filiformis]|uniref:organic solute transporter subunit alpha-like n=1 Tax=Amphiura filiformis TaxID=82378 RepID=UPI003B21EE51